MRFQNIIFILLISIVFTGCGSCENQPKEKEDTPTVITSPSTTPNAEKSPEVTGTPIEKEDGSELEKPQPVEKPKEKVAAVTLKPLIESYCAAMRNGDNVSLEKVFSKKALSEMKKEMSKEGIATLSEYLEFEAVGNKCEVVNEEIEGNTAKAEVITETYPKGTSFIFVKENNEWKMTNESEELDRVDNN